VSLAYFRHILCHVYRYVWGEKRKGKKKKSDVGKDERREGFLGRVDSRWPVVRPRRRGRKERGGKRRKGES